MPVRNRFGAKRAGFREGGGGLCFDFVFNNDFHIDYIDFVFAYETLLAH